MSAPGVQRPRVPRMLEFVRDHGRTVAMCHACFLQCESAGATTETARANLPCSYAMMEFAMDAEQERWDG